MVDILSAVAGIFLLELIVIGRRYKHHLEMFRGDWLFTSVKFWYIAGLVLAAGSQYLFYISHCSPEFILTVNAIALYLAYIQICKD